MLLWATLLPGAAQELQPEEIYHRLLPSIVTLQVEDSAGGHYVGTGFLSLGDGLAVTAWHVVADARKVGAKFSDNRFVEVLGLVDKNEKMDLALIRLAASNGPPVRLSASEPAVGSRAYVIGAPKGFDFSIADGLISQVRTLGGLAQYQLSCPISAGNSGGPLVNACGEVTGVISWRKTDAANLSFATPARDLESLDPTLPLQRWTDLGESARARTPAVIPGEPPVVTASSELNPGFSEFLRVLQDATDEELTVSVLRNGTNQSFKFVVPSAPTSEAFSPNTGKDRRSEM